MPQPRCLALALLLLVSLAVAADDTPKRQGDPQSSYEPRSNPGIGQKFLQKLVGDWEAAKTLYPRSGEPIRMKGECRQTMMHDGRFLKSEFIFDHNGSKTTGLGIVGFETETGLFTSVWTDARSTRISMRQSQGALKGDEIVLYGKSLNDDGKNLRRSRTVTRLEDNGRKIVHRAYVSGPDGKERLMMEILMTPKAS
jgi:hypothetical protein